MATRREKAFRFFHLFGTAWFISSAMYMLVVALRQAGHSWWLIMSVSGHSALAAFFLVSIYLVAIYREVSISQATRNEHPFTTQSFYLFFYDTCPFLGALAGLLAAAGVSTSRTDILCSVSTGTMWVTFAVWIAIDPAIGMVEMLLPASRRLRRQRHAMQQAKRLAEQKRKVRLLAEIKVREEQDRSHWVRILKPDAEKLADLLAEGESHDRPRWLQAVDMGVKAWRLGGLQCMRQLRSMALEQYALKTGQVANDYISVWWDGIGQWRSHWLEGA